jgi:outer membrane receptor protein involved in Fe transport
MVFGKQIDLRLSVNNLLYETYIAHLSGHKFDFIPYIGRNFNLGLLYPF